MDADREKRRFVFGVDLDGVVADFYAAMKPIAAEWRGVPEEELPSKVTYGVPEWKLDEVGGYDDVHRFAITQRNLFRDLRPIDGAPAALRRMSAADIRIRIITHRLYIKYFHREALEQTIEWLDRHGIPYWDLCFMKDKGAVGADLYIEDSPRNVEQLRNAGHDTIVFANSTNRELPAPRARSWDEVEKLVSQFHSKWLEKKKDGPDAGEVSERPEPAEDSVPQPAGLES